MSEDTLNVAPNTTDLATLDTSVNQPLTAEAAFDQLVEQYEKETSGEALPNTNTPVVEDSSTKDVQIDNTQTQPEPFPTNVAPTGIPMQTEDTRQLADKLVQEKDNHIKLLNSRLQELSTEYQNLKQYVQQAATAATAQQEPEKNLSPELKEFYELYPDLAKAVEIIADSKVKSASDVIEQKMVQTVAPVVNTVKQTREQQFLGQILQEYPNAVQDVQNGSLGKWVQSLDPVAKRGVQYVLNYGTVPEVKAMLNNFYGSQQTSNVQTQQTQTNTPLVNKVLSAMTMPSNKQEPTVVQNNIPQTPLTEKEAFDKLAAEYEKEMAMWRR